jgi:hypothetical protein
MKEDGDRSEAKIPLFAGPETLIFTVIASGAKQSRNLDIRRVWDLDPKPLKKGLKPGVWGFKSRINLKGYRINMAFH